MAVPNNQFDLGTSDLNGSDGDTLRQAGEKYNTHTHQTASAQAAIDGADEPAVDNVFITESALATELGDYTPTASLGSAALLDTGTSIGDVVEVVDVGAGVPGLPAIDGSQLLNLPGGGGGGYQEVTLPILVTGLLGPAYTTDNAAPATTPPPGSVHLDADDEEVYYRDSAGWQGPTAMPGAPVTIATSDPFPWNGIDGDYYCTTTELEFYGPKAGGSWGMATSIPGWSVIEVMGTPTALDGTEGDYAWQDMGGGDVRVWGPRSDTAWPTEFLEFSGVDTATPKIYLSAPTTGFAAGDELWIRPGTGSVIHGSGTAYFSNGYTIHRLVQIDPGESIPAGSLIVGAELEHVAVTYGFLSADRIQVKALIDTEEMNLGTETLPVWFPVTETGITQGRSLIKRTSAGGDLFVELRYGSDLNVGSVEDFEANLTLFYFGAA